MNAIQLQTPDGRVIPAWMCEVCNLIYGEPEYANCCCRCSHCGQRKRFDESHPDCAREQSKQREEARMEDAAKLDSWDGHVFFEGITPNFLLLDELVREARLTELTLPEFVYVAPQCAFPEVSVDDILDDIEANMYEEAKEFFKGVDELGKAVDAFNTANAGTVFYEVDYTRAVRVPKALATEDLVSCQ